MGGRPGTPSAGTIGLLNLSPDKPFWDVPLPHGMQDNFKSSAGNERRRWPTGEVLHLGGTAPDGAAGDLGQGLRLEPGRVLR